MPLTGSTTSHNEGNWLKAGWWGSNLKSLFMVYVTVLSPLGRATINDMSRQRGSGKNSAKKSKYKNQDKNRWRKVAAWGLPFIVVPVGFSVSAHDLVYLWTSVFVWIVFFLYILILLEWHIWRQNPARNRVRLCFFILCLVLFFGALKWQSRFDERPSPPHRPWLRLTEEEKRKFVARLASQTEPRERIRLGCPVANEDICVQVTQFVDAFKRGHFIVENNRVDRITLAQPMAGVVLFKYTHPHEYDAQDPDQGRWIMMTNSLETIEGAFAEIGINSRTTADPTLPEDVIGVFFGIESQEPIERLDLKKLKQEADEQFPEKPKQ